MRCKKDREDHEQEKRVHDKIEIIPRREFLHDLWNGNILK